MPYEPFLLGVGVVFNLLKLRVSLVVGFGGIQAVDTEFPYRVLIVDRGTIAAALFAAPVSDA